MYYYSIFSEPFKSIYLFAAILLLVIISENLAFRYSQPAIKGYRAKKVQIFVTSDLSIHIFSIHTRDER